MSAYCGSLVVAVSVVHVGGETGKEVRWADNRPALIYLSKSVQHEAVHSILSVRHVS